MRFLPFPIPGARSIAPNILTNGGFETDTTGWNTTNCSLTRITTDARFGAACLQAASTGGTSFIPYSDASVSGATAGRRYAAEVWVKGVGGTIGKTVSLTMSEVGGGSGTADYTGLSVTLTAGWQRLTKIITVAQNDRTAVRIRPVVTAVSGDVVLFDGARVVRV